MSKPKDSKPKPFKGIIPERCKMCGNQTTIMVHYDEFRQKLKMTCGYCGHEWYEDTWEQRGGDLSLLPPGDQGEQGVPGEPGEVGEPSEPLDEEEGEDDHA